MDEEKAFELIRQLRAALHLAQHENGLETAKSVDELVDEAEGFLIENGESDWSHDE